MAPRVGGLPADLGKLESPQDFRAWGEYAGVKIHVPRIPTLRNPFARLLTPRRSPLAMPQANPPPPEEPTPPSGLEALLRWVPGFAGYLRREDRARSDARQRQWLADRLERGKQGLERYARALVDAVQLEALTPVDRLRQQTDQLIGRIRGAVRGGGGLLGATEADAARLEELYAHDLSLIEQVAATADAMDRLGDQPKNAEATLNEIAARLDALADAWDEREDLLSY